MNVERIVASALVRSSPNSIDKFEDLAPHRQEAWLVRARAALQSLTDEGLAIIVAPKAVVPDGNPYR